MIVTGQVEPEHLLETIRTFEDKIVAKVGVSECVYVRVCVCVHACISVCICVILMAVFFW